MERRIQDESLNNRQSNLTLLLPNIKTEEDYAELVNDNDLLIHKVGLEDNLGNNSEQVHNENSTLGENHKCSQCNAEFSELKYLQLHEAVHDSNMHCPACDRIYKSERHFILHIQSHLKNPLKCQHCPEIFWDKRSYNLHLYCHRKNKTYICEYCFKEWSNKKDLQIHIRVHTNERPYSCDVCGKSFKQRGGLRAHVDTLHSIEKMEVIKERFPCEICNGSYSSVSSLNKHVRKIHETGKTFPCKKCGETFLNFLQMKQHKIEAHPELVYTRICPLCSKAFYCRESFVKHQYTHLDTDEQVDKHDFVTPISCYLCGEEVGGRKAFTKHQQIHLLMTDEELEECIKAKKFNCKVCEKSFNFKKNLFRHMDVHLEKTFQCISHCTEKFTYLGIRFHLEWHLQQFHCSECNETFIGRKNLKKHYRVHPTRVKFTCKICGHKFRYRHLLTTHWKMQHNLKCHVCIKKFVTHLALKRHIKRKHKVNSDSSVQVTKVSTENKVVQSVDKYDCKICKRSFNTKLLLRDHSKLHKKKCFQCDNCKRHFLYFRNLLFHVKQNICLKYFDNRMGLKQFNCILCKKEYDSLEKLASHTRIHTTIYKCKFCNSKFKHKDLQEHINRAHPGEAMFFCDKCTMHFFTVNDLVKHRKYFHRGISIKNEPEDSSTGQDVECNIQNEKSEGINLHNNECLAWIKEEPEDL